MNKEIALLIWCNVSVYRKVMKGDREREAGGFKKKKSFFHSA